MYSDVFQFRGSHYDFGYWQGELLKDSPILPNRAKQWESRKKRHFNIKKDEAIQAILRFAPGILDELYGLADALKMSIEEALVEFGGYYLEYGKSGCSIFTTSDFLVRNYDNHPISYEGRYVLYQPTDQGYAAIGPTMQITGRTDGINEKGLAMGYNFVNRINSGDGFVCNMVGRILLEVCSSVDEAVSLLQEIPHRTTFSYCLMDPNGQAAIVEASPRNVIVRYGNACTNHFETLTNENRYRMDESVQRLERIQSGGEHVTKDFEAFQLMNSKEKGVFSNKYGAWAGTLHTALYLPKEKIAWFALGGNRMPVIIDFEKWLQGEKVNIRKIKGKLESTTPFINMEFDL